MENVYFTVCEDHNKVDYGFNTPSRKESIIMRIIDVKSPKSNTDKTTDRTTDDYEPKNSKFDFWNHQRSIMLL